MDELYLANNRFDLVDLEALHATIVGGEHRITANLVELTAEFLRDGKKETDACVPATQAYLDLWPQENDARLDKNREFHFLTIEEGKPVTLGDGIFRGPEYLDSGNVCLEVSGIQKELEGKNLQGDTGRKLFALCPKTGEKAEDV